MEEQTVSMTPRKTERIMNLTIALLVAGRYLSKSRLRDAVEGYHHLSDGAFERTFERDKDELRSLGVPIEVGNFDPMFDDEPGYRIRPGEFSLPPIELDADEAAVVGVAARVWQHASMAESTQSAMSKLRAAGVDPDPSALAALEPSVQASEPAFSPLWTAVLERTRMSFTYRDGQVRTVEPWGLTSRRGRWYVVGRDVDRDANRMFKLSRILDLPRRVSRTGAYEVPDDVDLRALGSFLDSQEPTEIASLAIRTNRAPSLRRRGEPLDRAAACPEGFECLSLRYSSVRGLSEELAGHGADVLVLEPTELREAVRQRLRAVAASGGPPPPADSVEVR